MKRLLVLGILAAVAVPLACRSAASKNRIYQTRINQLIAQNDRYVQQRKPAYAIRYYTKYIPYYERNPALARDVARMYMKRAEAYQMLGNARMVAEDMARAQRLDPSLGGTVQVPSAPPATAPAAGTAPPATAPVAPAAPAAPATGPEGIPFHQGDPIPIAVMNFESATEGKDYGKTFSPLLADDLFNRGRFDVIERDTLDKIVAEKKLTQTDLVAKAGSAEGRELLQVTYLVMGTITVEGNAVIINGRFVDWNTGQTVVSQTTKRICQTPNVSFYFDELAHELGVKLEKAFVERNPAE